MLRRKYGPWQPPAARSGGSGRAIGVTFRPVILSGAGLRPGSWAEARGGERGPGQAAQGQAEPVAAVQLHGEDSPAGCSAGMHPSVEGRARRVNQIRLAIEAQLR